MQTQRLRVVVIGGYGFFGSRLVERLSRQPGLDLLVAGRSLESAQALAASLAPAAQSPLTGLALDIADAHFAARLAALKPAVVVHAGGPFQGQDYRVAQACMEAGAHCMDLADGRVFVTGIRCLEAPARAAGVMVISGASSVPALSTAAADELARGMTAVHRIDIGISPGNRTDRGLATVQAVLSGCGQPLPAEGGGQRVYGWCGSYRHRYPTPVGRRLLSPCDVPDLDLLPTRYPERPIVRFSAGLELTFLHRGLNAMAYATRRGWVRSWDRHAALLKRVSDAFRHWGSDAGAMHVRLQGIDAQGAELRREWQLVAADGHGPYVPTLAASALVRRLAQHGPPFLGARPCVGLLTLQDFRHELDGLHITTEPSLEP